MLGGELAKTPCQELRGLSSISLALGNLGPENALQPASERRRDPDALVESLDLSFEHGGGDVAALRASRAPRVPPDAPEVPKRPLATA